jgi:hypothetical protein
MYCTPLACHLKMKNLIFRHSTGFLSYISVVFCGELFVFFFVILYFLSFDLSWVHNFESFTVATMTWLTVIEYLYHKWPRICSTCRMHFPVLSTFITGFGTKLLRRVPLVEQELLTPPVHPSSPPIFSGFHVTLSFMCMFCRLLFVLLYFFFWPFCSSSVYGFWLPLWYLQTLLIKC